MKSSILGAVPLAALTLAFGVAAAPAAVPPAVSQAAPLPALAPATITVASFPDLTAP